MSGSPQSPERQRLAAFIEARRAQLRMTLDDVGAKAGIHSETVIRVRDGNRPIRALTRRGLEDALRWEPGSIDAVLAGGDPTPVQRRPPEPAPPVNAAEDPDDEKWDEVRSGPPFLDPGETLRWRQVGDDEFRFCLTRPDGEGIPQHVWHNFDLKWAADPAFVIQYLRYRIDRFAIKTPRADREG